MYFCVWIQVSWSVVNMCIYCVSICIILKACVQVPPLFMIMPMFVHCVYMHVHVCNYPFPQPSGPTTMKGCLC